VVSQDFLGNVTSKDPEEVLDISSCFPANEKMQMIAGNSPLIDTYAKTQRCPINN